MNRTTLISLIVLAILALGGIMYFLFFKNTPSVTVAPAGSTSLPIAGQTTPQASTGATTGTPNTSFGTPVAVTARLVQISVGPVVPGEVVTDIKAANASSSLSVAVNYIERE